MREWRRQGLLMLLRRLQVLRLWGGVVVFGVAVSLGCFGEEVLRVSGVLCLSCGIIRECFAELEIGRLIAGLSCAGRG